MEKQKLIYVESKALFSPSEVSDKAIVFIEDTKEIWTHGVYFSCSGTWASPITLSLTGDTTGSVSIDGSGNASITTTTRYLSGDGNSLTDYNNAATTLPGRVTYYPMLLNNATNKFPTSNNANGILSLNVHDYSYTYLLGFSSDGNIYYRRRNGGTWETSWKTILNSSNYTNFPHTFASLTNKPTTLSGYGITDSIPIIKGGEVTANTDLSTLGMTTSGAKLSVFHLYEGPYPSWLNVPYMNVLMFRSTGDSYGAIGIEMMGSHTVQFIGGRTTETSTNNAPNWWFRIKGNSSATYDLNSFLNTINNLDGNYLRKSGGTMTGILALTTDTAYIIDTISESAIFGTVSTSNSFTGISGLETIFAGRLTNMVLRTSGDNLYHYNHSKSARYLILDTNNYSSYALPLSGGTMKGALNFANNTWNKVGDDAYMGDCNVAGMIGIKGSNATTPGFAMYNNIGTLLGKLYASGSDLYWSGVKLLTSTGSAQEAYLAWGGQNLASNSSPIDTILEPSLGANRLAFLSPDAIDIEYSQDGGTTWLNYNATDAQKVSLFCGGGNYSDFYLGGNGSTDPSIDRTPWRLRITISVIGYSLYCQFIKFLIYTTDVGNTTYCLLLGRKYSDYQNNVDTWVTFLTARIAGWSGWNTINHPNGITLPHTANYAQLRFEFYMTSLGTTGRASIISRIAGFAHKCWSWPSNMAGYGNIYSYDWQLNVTFPAQVTATGGFSGNLTGNVTGNVTGTATSANKANFLASLDLRSNYPALIVTAGETIGASFMAASKLGISGDGSYYDALIIRGYRDSTGGNENAIMFSKNTSSVYHSLYAFGSTTTWGTLYKFLDSNNYSSYALPLSGGTMTGNIILTTGKWIADSTTSTSILGTFASGNSTEGLYSEAGVLVGKTATQTTLSSNGDDLWHYRNSDKKRYKILDAANYTNYTIRYTKYGILHAGSVGIILNNSELYYHSALSLGIYAPDDNGGATSYELIAELPNYDTGTNTSYVTYGISGFMWSYRGGNCNNSSAYPITAIVSIGPYTSSRIRVPVTTNVLIPVIVKYTNKYYLALKKSSSSTGFYFMGQKLNLLTTTIKVNDASLIEEIKGPENETSTALYYYNKGNPQEYLHAGNYNNYTLPLAGGTLGSSTASFTDLFIKSSTAKLRLTSFTDSTTYIQSGNSDFTGNATLKITGYNSNTGSNLYLNFANIYCRGSNYTNIDSGNYNSYALPLSGGTLTGTLISRDIRPSANVSYSLGTSSYYYNYVYAKYFKKNGSSDSYVLLGGGGHKAVSDFAPNNVATLSSSGMGNSDLWTLVFEQSYPASHWYEPIAMFYVKGGTVGCGILCFYNYWNSATKLNAYEKEVWFFGAGKSETSATFGGTNRDINDYLRIYIDTANFKYYIYYNRYNDRDVKILELLFFESPDSLHSSFFTNSTTVVNLPTESSTLVRVPIKTTYNHDRTIKTSKSIYASSFYENSDIRLKENIRRIDLSDLTKLVDLVQFNFKDSDTKKYGVIAQQLESVGLQNLVYENDGKKAVDYISLLVLEIQRLRNEIGELKLEINKKS